MGMEFLFIREKFLTAFPKIRSKHYKIRGRWNYLPFRFVLEGKSQQYAKTVGVMVVMVIAKIMPSPFTEDILYSTLSTMLYIDCKN